jgi:hypothetical protein
MNDADDLTDDFETQIRPLIQAIRNALEEQLFTDVGDSSVGRILQDAPADVCVQLADAWSVADMVGVDPQSLLARFDPIDRFVVEMVIGIYSNSSCQLFDESHASILDGSGRMFV